MSNTSTFSRQRWVRLNGYRAAIVFLGVLSLVLDALNAALRAGGNVFQIAFAWVGAIGLAVFLVILVQTWNESEQQ